MKTSATTSSALAPSVRRSAYASTSSPCRRNNVSTRPRLTNPPCPPQARSLHPPGSALRSIAMRVTSKGQVTIPQHVRALLGITPGSEVDFHVDEHGARLVRVNP